MATYLLVHGAWQGASTWAFVEEGLRSKGHSVFVPTLSGAGGGADAARNGSQ